jgi:TPR repeat protein
VRKADQYLGRGDVVGARALYRRAVEMGSGPAALALGATFDPNRLWSLGVFGMVGNRERARQWYVRADQLGHPDAKSRLKSLGN